MKSKNSHRFKDLYGQRDKEVMYATANKLAQKKQTKQKTWKSGMGFKEEVVTEKCETRYCRLCKKKETRKQCSYGPNMWDRYAVKDASDTERKEAAEESGITNGMGESLEDAVLEANKSGDNSLRDWFSKSKSSDGKPGWVQLGGKYAGKPCARQPGQTTKPKCGSSKMKRNLNKDEEEAAFRRKQKEDPNPDRKGKAINVKTEATYPQDFRNPDGSRRAVAKKKTGRPNAQGDYGKKDLNERGDFWHPDPDKDRKLGGPGANQRAREDRAASRSSSSSSSSGKPKLKPGESYMEYAKRVKAMKTRKEDCWDGYEKKGMKTMFGKKYPNCVKKTKTKKEEVEVQEGMGDVAIKAIRATQGKKPAELSKRTALIRKIKQKQLDSYLKKRDAKKKERVTNVGMGEDFEYEGELMTEEQFDEAAGEKDACYKKVKARYSVWPSAYASGALVKCRKVGAANWGNKSKK